MRNLDKKFIKEHSHQEIIVTGSPLLKLLETIGVWLHIVAFILGLVSVAGLIAGSATEGEASHGGIANATHIVEYATLFVVALIIIQFAITPFIERAMLKYLLKEFWGTNEIATSFKYATDIDTLKNFGTVVNEVTSLQLEETKLDWRVIRWFPFKRVLTIQQCTPITTKRWSRYAANDGTLNVAIIPIYIIIDVHQKTVKFQGRANILFSRQKNIPEKRIMFTFHYKDKTASWSGIFPEHPMYGEWLWDNNIADEIRSGTAGKKNQAMRNNKAVAAAFRERKSQETAESDINNPMDNNPLS